MNTDSSRLAYWKGFNSLGKFIGYFFLIPSTFALVLNLMYLLAPDLFDENTKDGVVMARQDGAIGMFILGMTAIFGMLLIKARPYYPQDLVYDVYISPNVAFTVIYEDRRCKLHFVIEADDTPKKIFLNPNPLLDGESLLPKDSSTAEQIAVAVGRVKRFFEGQGLSVELDYKSA